MNSSSTSENILLCAQSLIVAGGYNGFSYADIAKVVGVRNASIHHHFPSKAILVQTLVVRYRQEVEAGIAEMERQVTDPLGQLCAYTGFWETCIDQATASFCVCALLASEMPLLPEEIALEVRAHFRSLSAWLASVFERGAKLGRFELSALPKVEAEIFMAAMHGAMLSARAYGDPKMFGAIINPVVERLVRKG
ncbi:TetR/AcrR family transcriptional regulator [Herbaspirillum lusitanum]|uniref:TetR/AcrR family transcriptional regulator n=1 Tax=Herbaspirillum lusitanum TaxID=213312 RepID=A0ABW9AE41_9BURK